MTDYGRGSGSEPWHPEDPLFGDVYEPGRGYQQQPNPQQDGGWQDPYATGQQPQYPQQGYPQEQYPQHQQYPQGQQPQQTHPQQHQAQHPQQHQPQQGQQYPQGQYVQQPQHPQQAQQPYPQQMDYGNYPNQDPYGGQQQPQDPYGNPDYYGQNGYPPQQQPQYRQQPGQQQVPQAGQQGGPMPGQYGQPGHPGQPQQGEPGPQQPGPHQAEPAARPMRTAPADTGSWDPDEGDADPREHAFFADRDDDEDEDDAPSTGGGGRRAGKSQSKGGRKRRSGCACMVVVLVLGGGLGGAGYFGYNLYQSHFGPAPDYAGQGSGDVQVEIPDGATATTMGNLLKTAGVVKSVDAFTSAASKNPNGQFIQAGVYILHKQMSAAAAVTMMLDPSSQNALIIAEGLRATEVYKKIDEKLGLKTGTTAADVKGVNLGLPSWAKGNVEGFLFPAKYSVAKTTKPVDLVKDMVNRANAEFTEIDLEGNAAKVGKSPEDILTIASLVQAEAQEPEDFGKVSRVIYNRLDQDMALGFDSTINYAMGRSTLSTSVADTQYDSPYNTYIHKGLPPGPISNPGSTALDAALNPTAGDWLYFVTVKPGDTRFTDSYAEHEKNVEEFNQYQKDHPS